ncbi:MAG: HD domain-containing protein [Oscillospiraceae bacterium]|nr:HD domain-containing protein [Oscillospiraceae bacterium]
MLPSRSEAEKILCDGEAKSPGTWASHSRVTARTAEAIAERCCSLDADKAYILGLLHDIGRSFGESQMRHVYDGYRYMLSLGYDEAARVCLTHSFNRQRLDDYVGQCDITFDEKKELEELLLSTDFDDYDRLIQLCDGLAGKTRVIRLEERAEDIELRYGSYPERKLEKNLELKAYFEKMTGEDLYRLLDIR